MQHFAILSPRAYRFNNENFLPLLAFFIVFVLFSAQFLTTPKKENVWRRN
jgi:hypothetical protein